MPRRFLPVLALLALACGGPGGVSPAEQATTPEGAVRAFMQAVADSNITRMASYWGTKNGPARVTRQPADFEQRLAVTQIYLRHSPYQITQTDEVPSAPERRVVRVELERRDADGTSCTRDLPITVVNVKNHGWIVSSLDLSLVGTPGRACKATGRG